MESMSSNRRLIESGGARVDDTLVCYLVVEKTIWTSVQWLGDLNRPSESLECVIALPRLVLEVLVGLVLHLLRLVFLDTQVELVPSSGCIWRSNEDSALDCLE